METEPVVRPTSTRTTDGRLFGFGFLAMLGVPAAEVGLLILDLPAAAA
jgi:hypothetical protein